MAAFQRDSARKKIHLLISTVFICGVVFLSFVITSSFAVEIPLFEYSDSGFTRGDPGAKRGGWLTLDMTGDPAHLNPLTAKDEYEMIVNGHIQGTLVTWDIDTDEPLPFIADAWIMEETPEGGQKFLFHINPIAKFSDGVSVTANDVLFSYRVFFDDDYPTAHNRPYYSSVKSCRVLDASTIEFITKDTYYLNFVMLGSLIILPQHYYEPYMVAKYKEKKENPEPNASRSPLGCGPYIFVEWIQGKRILLKRDHHWFGDQLPHFKNCYNFDMIQLKIIKDAKIALEHFKRGDIDYYTFTATQWVRETDSEPFRSGHLRKIEVKNKAPRYYSFIGWNLIDPELSNLSKQEYTPHHLFGNRNVRLAMTYLIDRDLYVSKYSHGFAMKAVSPFGNLSDYSDPSIVPYPFDPDKALQLLRGEGWDDLNLNGILEKKIDGVDREFIFTLLIPTDTPAMEAMATIIKEDMKSVGVIMKIKTVEWNSFQKLTDDKDYDAFSMSWTLSTNPDPRGLWDCASAAPGGNNIVTYCNPAVDALSQEAVRTMDKRSRIQLFHQIHRLIYEDQPYTFLTEPLCDLIGVNQRIRMMNSPHTGLPYFNYGIGAAQYWWVNPSSETVPTGDPS